MSDSGSTPGGPAVDELAPQLREGLLTFLADRLGRGDVLITAGQFQEAAEEGYRCLTGAAAEAAAKRALGEFLAAVHRQNPAQLLGPGVENWVSLSVLAQVRKAGMGITDVQERGTQLIRDFLRSPKARGLLAQLGLGPTQLNMSNCLRFVVNRVAGRQDDAQKRAASRLARLAATLASAAAPAADAPAAVEGRLDELLEGPRSLPDEAETRRRHEEQTEVRARLQQSQMKELVANLENYVSLGLIRAEDAEGVRKVHRVDEAVRAGTVGPDKGSKIRNSILTGQARDRIERKMREALDYAVAYLQVFVALGRIDPRFDPALRFLARHAEQINAEAGADGAPPDLGPAVADLLAKVDDLRLLIDIMDRKDAEVRMIAARLPPYSYIVKRDQGRLERVAVDEGFVGELRSLSTEELSRRLHSADRKERARPAAAMLSLAVLVNRLIKPTPFRKELRTLKLNLIVEEFYRTGEDTAVARQKAQEFLHTRIHTLYPDVSREEMEDLQRRGEQIIAAVEQRVVAARAPRAPVADTAASDAEGGEDEEGLSEDERGKGVQIRRVSVRGSAGRVRHVRYKVMPDPDDGERFFIVQRDPASGAMVPVLRRGAKRYVERERDGSWELARD